MSCYEDTLVVIPYFNYYPNERRLAILKDSLFGLSRCCDVWLVHCGDSLPFSLPIAHSQLNSPDALRCFQKEALINHAIHRLLLGDHPSYLNGDYKRVIFLDADVVPLGTGTWSEFISHCKSYGPRSYGQPCSHFLTPQGLLESTTGRISRITREDLTYEDIQGTAPGGCWVVGIEALGAYYQYPYCFVGGGDTVYAVSHIQDLDYKSFYLNNMNSEIRENVLSFIKVIKANQQRVNANYEIPRQPLCLHSLDHGQAKTKNYVDRHQLYNLSGIISSVSIQLGELVKVKDTNNGLLLKSFISGYMESL